MFVFMWATLLFAPWRIGANKAECPITLTCSTAALCPGYVPKVNCTWNGKQNKVLYIKGNTTVSRGETSEFTFNLSSDLNGTQVTCETNCTINSTTEGKATLNDTTSQKGLNSSSGCQEKSVSSILTELNCTQSKHRVSISVTISVGDRLNAAVECGSLKNPNEEHGEQNKTTATLNDAVMKVLKIVTQLEVIVAFFSGVLLSTIFCCLLRVCCRKKQKANGNVEALEMAACQKSSLMEHGQGEEDDQDERQEAAEDGAGAAAGPLDVEYSTIHFSATKSSSVAKMEDLPETEYAEIKIEAGERRAAEDREETGNIEEDEEKLVSVMEGDDAALFSDVVSEM